MKSKLQLKFNQILKNNMIMHSQYVQQDSRMCFLPANLNDILSLMYK